jgi:Tol biopolymer transport system component
MTLDRDRWLRVKAILHSALSCAPDERAQLVCDACGDDVPLRHEVESLLAAHAEAGRFGDRPAIDALRSGDFPVLRVGVPRIAPGFELGLYRILAPLDAGGMGEVYRALDMRLGREVALKVLPTALSDDPERVARLEREARLLAALNHPNIATIHGFEVAGRLHAVVMELIEGPTLAERLSNGPLSLSTTTEIAIQIADALEAAHRKGIIHRDLKPANVKLTAAGKVKVLDFGLAKAIAPDPREASATPTMSVPATRRGVIAGTPAYMSPEQARGDIVDERSDVWAFGCVLYEMLTGRPVFGSTTMAETLAAILERDPDWNRLSPATPASLRRVLRRCLEKDPRRRLHHIADARIEIEDAVGAAPEYTSAVMAAPNARWLRSLGIATTVLAIALIAAIGAWLFRPSAVAPELRVVEITTPWTSDLWSFAVSPDGRRIAYVADRDGQPTLWLRSLDTADARPLAATDRARRPFWSPDSRSIAFFADGYLKRIEARGGSVQTIASGLGGTAGTWGADGTILFSSTPVPGISRVNAGGGNVGMATTPTVESTGHRHPQFLPGGGQFLFFAGGPDGVRGVYLGALGSSEVTRIVASDTQATYVSSGWLLFIRQGTLLAQRFDLSRRMVSGDPIIVADSVAFDPISGAGAFSTSDAGVITYRTGRPSMTRLVWFDRSGNALGTLGSPEQSGLSTFTLSPDGRRIAAERTVQNETDLWLLDSARQMRLTHETGGTTARLPVWSRDGARLAFQSIGPNSMTLSAKRLTAERDEQVLFRSPEVKVPCDWSPDGRFLLYYVADRRMGADLWVLPMDTQRPFVFLRTETTEVWGQFSPDGRWVAYHSNETGRFEVYVRPFPPSGGAVPISTAGGVYARWSRDGKELYYLGPDAKMMAVPIRATAPTIEAGVPTALFQTRRVGGGLNVIGRGHQYDVTADGRFLVNVEAGSTAPPITLLLNWKP